MSTEADAGHGCVSSFCLEPLRRPKRMDSHSSAKRRRNFPAKNRILCYVLLMHTHTRSLPHDERLTATLNGPTPFVGEAESDRLRTRLIETMSPEQRRHATGFGGKMLGSGVDSPNCLPDRQTDWLSRTHRSDWCESMSNRRRLFIVLSEKLHTSAAGRFAATVCIVFVISHVASVCFSID